MKIFKFGGASIETVERAKKVAQLIINEKPSLVVISAKGKTTNALEEIAKAFCDGELQIAKQLYAALEKNHIDFATDLLGNDTDVVFEKLNHFFTEMDWILNEKPLRDKNYYYDQIVSIGELLSTAIIQAYLEQENCNSIWLDARDFVKTNDDYKDAKVDWDLTESLILEKMPALINDNKIIITQGFIGSTDENNSITLGREGSDFSAAIFAYCLNAESVTIWKDVPGLLNADPKLFKDTEKIADISFREVIELAFYGAQVIHPKTIKPLQNKNIPMYVKCFLDEKIEGTKIHSLVDKKNYPPLMVYKKNQVMIRLSTKDFSFMNEENLSIIYKAFSTYQLKMNITQNAAISFVCCVDDVSEKIEKVLASLEQDYKIRTNFGVEILTIRHYNTSILSNLLENRLILLEQKTRTTAKYILK
ncbi:MAG: aspartate kinase [Chitinophagaceae bacterium]|nr:aspartate kinase [Chitinophagaceae bacterium]